MALHLKRTALEADPRGQKKARRREPLTGHLDIQAFPHVVDAVLDAASPEALQALRATSRELQDQVDARFGRHVRLQMTCADGERSNFGRIGDGTLAHRVRCRSALRSGLPGPGPSQHTCVLDVDLATARMWYEYTRKYTYVAPGFGGGWGLGDEAWNADEWGEADIRRHGGSLAAIRARVARNVAWFTARPRLVRYLDGIFGPDQTSASPGHQTLKPDPCAVYFCKFEDFMLGLNKLSAHHEVHGAPQLDTVFNVTLEFDMPRRSALNSWERLAMLHSPKHWGVRTNRFTVLFQQSAEFLSTVTTSDCEFFAIFLRVLVHNYLAQDRGSATIVGYETWDIGTLADPSEEDGLGPGPAPLAPRGSGNAGAAAVGDRVRRWVAIYAQKERAWMQRKGIAVELEKDGSEAVHLLTLDEWRAEIGEEYFRLMTDKEYKYQSSRALPPLRHQKSALPSP